MLINAWSQRVLVKPKNLQKAVIFRCIDSFCKKKKYPKNTDEHYHMFS